MKIKLYQVDAFTSQLFQGNPAAVCPLERWLPDSTLQAIAAENNLAETAFYVPQREDFGLRWFTPTVEVDLCGHATLATAHVLFTVYRYPQASVRFHTRSGELTVTQQQDWLTLNFPADTITAVEPPEALMAALGATPQEIYRGKSDYLAVMQDQPDIEALTPDFRLLATLHEVRGVIVTAAGEDTDFVSRCFYPQSGIDEDPVTGSAHTTLVPYWADRLKKHQLTARQLSRRTGFLKCAYLQNRVEISGQAVTYLSGEMEV